MNEHQSESKIGGLYDRSVEIYAAPPVNPSHNLNDLGLDELDLGDGPFDPGPLMDAQELVKLCDLEKRQEAEAGFRPNIDDLNAQPVAEKAEAGTETRDQALLRLAGGYCKKLRQPKPKTARKSQLSPRQVEIIEYRKSPEGKPLWNDYQNAKRWAKAELEGRAIIRRKSLKDMTPEEKAERKREQAAQRQRKRRAKKKMTQPMS